MPDLKIPGSRAGLAVLASCCLIIWAFPAVASAVPVDSGNAGDSYGNAAAPGRVTLVALPQGVTPQDLAGLGRSAIGLMNPGLGEVSAQQTWLDVSQGSRVFDITYDTSLDNVNIQGETVWGWQKVLTRARSAESPVIPGLLASSLGRHGVDAVAGRNMGDVGLAVVRRNGRITPAPPDCGSPEAGRGHELPDRSGGSSPGYVLSGCSDPVTALSMSVASAFEAADRRPANDLMIFVESPPAEAGDQLTIAIAGPRFRGMLRSPSTRTDGYVLSTDIAPTILRHFGLGIPKAMTGLPVESGGELDLERLAELEGRYEQVGKRRGAALAIPLLVWIALAGLVSLGSRGRYARPAVRLLCLSTVLLPGVLLLTAALSPSLGVERAVASFLPVLIAAILLRLAAGWQALALACGLTVIPYGIDMLAGSVLTPLSVIGPNPGLGARFYGIGNELESTLMILTSVGVGAALTWARADRRRAAVTFLVAGLVSTVVFAAGRFGADVGAAIVFPVAAVVAASLAAGRPRLAWAGLAVAAAALALVAVADIVTGSETHFVRSIVGGNGDSFFGVIGHRLDATLESFTRISRIPVTIAALIVIALAVWKRQMIREWLEGLPMIQAGIAAAAAGSVVGAVTNDSGALFIQVGTLYVALVLGFAWANLQYDRASG